MKEITKYEMQKLFENKMIRNTDRGIVNQNGNAIGFYRTKSKRYIEDNYLDMAQRL